jgi:hypothetical protein
MISAIESNIYRDNSKMTEADVDGELSFALYTSKLVGKWLLISHLLYA